MILDAANLLIGSLGCGISPLRSRARWARRYGIVCPDRRRASGGSGGCAGLLMRSDKGSGSGDGKINW